jgi:hypothetical protein
MGGPTALGQFRSGTTVLNVKSFYAFVLVRIYDLQATHETHENGSRFSVKVKKPVGYRVARLRLKIKDK